jgi:hypothetical protein
MIKGFPHVEDLVCQTILGWDGGNIGSILSPLYTGFLDRGTGIPRDRDEVNRREVSECDG